MLLNALFLIAGFIMLYYGAEALVSGSVRFGLRCGLAPLTVGLTIVAFGTSAPELFVSVRSSLLGQGGLAMGNVIGSNLFNISVILAASVIIRPIRVHLQLIRLDVPLLIAISLLLCVLLMDGVIGRTDGALLTAGIIAYVVFAYFQSRTETAPEIEREYAGEVPRPGRSPLFELGLIVLGLAVLALGSYLLVEAAVSTAQAFGVAEAFIGLTIVAAGTSLPEMATSIVATLKDEGDIAVGNVVGSCIFNLLCIPGIAGLIHPFETTGILPVDLIFMLVATAVLLPVMITGFELKRWEGWLLLSIYAAFLGVRWPS